MIIRKIRLYVEGKAHEPSLCCGLCQKLLHPDTGDYMENLLMELSIVDAGTPSPVALLGKCADHFFHKECVEKAFSRSSGSGGGGGFVCPHCKASY